MQVNIDIRYNIIKFIIYGKREREKEVRMKEIENKKFNR